MMKSIEQDESGNPPHRHTKGLTALPGYRSTTVKSPSKAQIATLFAAIFAATGTVVGIVVAGMGVTVPVPDAGIQEALSFCEKLYSYPEFVDAHGTTGWALIR